MSGSFELIYIFFHIFLLLFIAGALMAKIKSHENEMKFTPSTPPSALLKLEYFFQMNSMLSKMWM